MHRCPKCGSPRVHRSRARTISERARKNFTADRLHRCHACGWRGWGAVTADDISLLDAPDRDRPAPDLSAIDRKVADQVNQAAGSEPAGKEVAGMEPTGEEPA